MHRQLGAQLSAPADRGSVRSRNPKFLPTLAHSGWHLRSRLQVASSARTATTSANAGITSQWLPLLKRSMQRSGQTLYRTISARRVSLPFYFHNPTPSSMSGHRTIPDTLGWPRTKRAVRDNEVICFGGSSNLHGASLRSQS